MLTTHNAATYTNTWATSLWALLPALLSHRFVCICSWFNRNIVSSTRLYYESMGPYAPHSQTWYHNRVKASYSLPSAASPLH